MRSIVSLIFLFITLCAGAQTNVFGSVVSLPDSVGLGNCNISLLQGDSIVHTVVAEVDGGFFIRNVTDGKYILEADALGYEDYSAPIDVKAGVSPLMLYMKPRKVTQLNELVVEGDRSKTLNVTSGGLLFYLSPNAKKERDPFKALQEIPLLLSDITNRTVSLISGESPLILIDGKRIHSGIAPILPADIESVEVITSPSARYMKEGVKAIINIKLKRKERTYTWYELATRHEVPIARGFGVGYFEIGNPKYSLYGRLAGDYQHNLDVDKSLTQSNTGYSQQYKEFGRYGGNSVLGELLFKGNPTKDDYFAIQGYANYKKSDSDLDGKGTIDVVGRDAQPYTYETANREKNLVVTGGAYYMHTFDTKSQLEARLYYNFNNSRVSDNRSDFYAGTPVPIVNEHLFRNKRHSGGFSLDYVNEYRPTSSFSVGASVDFNRDKIVHALQPYSMFRHNQTGAYAYAGWVNRFFDKVWFNASCGVQALWLGADDFTRSFVFPRVATGINWAINSHNSLNLSYQYTNDAPGINQLLPYNTSTDQTIETVGNPNLGPQHMHYIPLTYTFYSGNWYITPMVYYCRIDKMFSPAGYTNDEGVFVSTYANLGHFQQSNASLSVNYRLKSGRIMLSGGCTSNYFPGQDRHHAFYVNLYSNYTYKKFYFDLSIGYKNQSINSPINWYRYHSPSTATAQVNYNFTPDFYIGVCLQNIAGSHRATIYTESDSYRQIEKVHRKDLSLNAWVLLRYTFRKNTDRKIKLEKVLESKEKGISITR